jgi:hypothetical protein
MFNPCFGGKESHHPPEPPNPKAFGLHHREPGFF